MAKKKIPGIHREFGNLAKTQGKRREFGLLSCKFPDSNGKRYFNICLSEAGKVCQVSFVYVIVTNHVNWHRENLRLDRENTGNLNGNPEVLTALFRDGMPSLSSSYKISGPVPVCWLLFHCFVLKPAKLPKS